MVCDSGDDSEVQDVEGTYKNWMEQTGACFVILRPDFYVAATAKDAADLVRRFDEVVAKLHLTQQG